MSNSATVVPVAGANVAHPPERHLHSVAAATTTTSSTTARSANVTISVENTGTGPLTNVRLTAVHFLDHPASILTTPLPAPIAASLADCASADGDLLVHAPGRELRPDHADPRQRDRRPAGRPDAQPDRHHRQPGDERPGGGHAHLRLRRRPPGLAVPSAAPGFARQPGGAQSTPFHVSSSRPRRTTCDVIRSPVYPDEGRLDALALQPLPDRADRSRGGPLRPGERRGARLDAGARTAIVAERRAAVHDHRHRHRPVHGTCEQTARRAGTARARPSRPSTSAPGRRRRCNPGGAFTGRLAYHRDPLRDGPAAPPERLRLRPGDGHQLRRAGPRTPRPTRASRRRRFRSPWPWMPPATACTSPTRRSWWPRRGATPAPRRIALTGALTNHTGPAGPTYTHPGRGRPATARSPRAATRAAPPPATATRWPTPRPRVRRRTGTPRSWRRSPRRRRRRRGRSTSATASPTCRPSNPFFRFIEMLLHRGVTGGCSPTTYCPSSSTTREQMAVFVLLSKEPPGYVPAACVAGTEIFNDVPATSPFCRWIEELARRGVVSGCGGGNYCPQSPVTREQMAIFVLRTLDPALVPPACVAAQPVPRRPRDQPVLPLDRGAHQSRRRVRLRRRQLLPAGRRHPRADGRLPRGDVRPHPVRPVASRSDGRVFRCTGLPFWGALYFFKTFYV